MIDQLWYTSSRYGLSDSVGMRVRAASEGLQDTRSPFFQAVKPFLDDYSLPPDIDLYSADPQTSPTCLAYLYIAGKYLLLNKRYSGRDHLNRPGNHFAHLLTNLPKEFDAKDAIALWRSDLWNYSDETLSNEQVRLPALEPQALNPAQPADFDFASLQDDLAFLIEAYFLLTNSQQLFIAGSPDQIATLIAGLTCSLPEHFLQSLTFSTYEHLDKVRALPHASALVIGTFWPTSASSQRDLPQFCYSGAGIALNLITGRRSTIEISPALSLLPAYAKFVSSGLASGNTRGLNDLLSLANSWRVNDLTSLLLVYKLWSTGTNQLTTFQPTEITTLFSSASLAGALLGQPGIQAAILDLAESDALWWQRDAHPLVLALKQSPSPSLDQGLNSLAKGATLRARDLVVAGKLTIAERLLTGVSTSLLGAEEAWQSLLRNLPVSANQIASHDSLVRDWLINKLAMYAPTADFNLIKPWLGSTWPDLISLFDSPARDPWKAAFAQQLICNHAFEQQAPTEIVSTVTRHGPLLEGAILSVVKDAQCRSAVIAIFSKLVRGDYPHKPRTSLLYKIIEASGVDIAFSGRLLSVANLDAAQVRKVADQFSSQNLISRLGADPAYVPLLDRYMSTLSWNDCQALAARQDSLPQKLKAVQISSGTVDKFLAKPNVDAERLQNLAKALPSLSASLSPETMADIKQRIFKVLAALPLKMSQLDAILINLGKPLCGSGNTLFIELLSRQRATSKSSNFVERIVPYFRLAAQHKEPPPDWRETLHHTLLSLDKKGFEKFRIAVNSWNFDERDNAKRYFNYYSKHHKSTPRERASDLIQLVIGRNAFILLFSFFVIFISAAMAIFIMSSGVLGNSVTAADLTPSATQPTTEAPPASPVPTTTIAQDPTTTSQDPTSTVLTQPADPAPTLTLTPTQAVTPTESMTPTATLSATITLTATPTPVLTSTPIPATPPPTPTVPAGYRSYTVQPGDTLSGIADRFLGDPSRAKDIQRPERESGGISSDELSVGELLYIPEK